MFKNNYDAVEFGKRVRKARKKIGMTQEQLAEALFLSVDSVSRIETGKGMCMKWIFQTQMMILQRLMMI